MDNLRVTEYKFKNGEVVYTASFKYLTGHYSAEGSTEREAMRKLFAPDLAIDILIDTAHKIKLTEK